MAPQYGIPGLDVPMQTGTQYEAVGTLGRAAKWLRTFGHGSSAIKDGTSTVIGAGFLGDIGKSLFGWVIVGAANILDATDSLVQGNVRSAMKKTVAGAVDTAVTAVNPLSTTTNLISWVYNGKSVGENFRTGTLDVLDSIFGTSPRVTMITPAGIGTIGLATQPAMAQPGRFFASEAERRGINAQEAYTNYNKGEAEHVAALQAAAERAAAQGPQQRAAG